MIERSELEPDIEPEHELEVLAPEPKDGSKVSNHPTSPGLVLSRPRAFWTGSGPVQISSGLVRTGSGPVHSEGIIPMSHGFSHTQCNCIVTFRSSHVRAKERLWLEEHRKWLRGCDRLPGCEEQHKLGGSMNARQQCLTNHPTCVAL